MKLPANDRGNIEGLQILRAVAALMVVMFHARLSVAGASAWPKFGSTGVDIFFVISGFVMAYSTAGTSGNSPLRQRAVDARTFMERRVLRVVPLYWLGLAWMGKHELMHGHPSSKLVMDFFFIPHPNNSASGWLSPVLEQGWTLNYEMFFYLLFGLSMLAGARRLFVVTGILAALGVVGIALTWGGRTSHATGALDIIQRFYTNDIVLEFLYGIGLQQFVAWERTPRWPRWVFVLLSVAGFSALAALDDTWPRGVAQGIPAAVLVWAAMQACAGWRTRVLSLLGDASYSIYLFHWIAFWMAQPLCELIGPSEGYPMRVAALILMKIAIATAMGVLIHVTIERPILTWSKSHLRRGRRPAPLAAAATAQAD